MYQGLAVQKLECAGKLLEKVPDKDVYVDSGVGIPDRLERLWAPYRMSYITNRVGDTSVAEAAPKP